MFSCAVARPRDTKYKHQWSVSCFSMAPPHSTALDRPCSSAARIPTYEHHSDQVSKLIQSSPEMCQRRQPPSQTEAVPSFTPGTRKHHSVVELSPTCSYASNHSRFDIGALEHGLKSPTVYTTWT
ncbi:uncharacterized protein TrAtP1_012739 [Trichoderma atroviride]|uniref:uncharacterized protein n=1 Tax=Hypocrea atroviridis TaxID=63577 RepID=UPI003332AE7F|nr:hypothetical protein TrAtP1_012739 [Trichoderma atroviride]